MGWLRGVVAGEQGRPAGSDPSRRFKHILVFKFQGFSEFDGTWRNFTRRFRRNFDMEILPKFF
jgi:hypothetical protein